MDRVYRTLCEWLEPLPLEQRVIPQSDYSDRLIATAAAGRDGRQILLAGHMDTIFPADSPFDGWREDEALVYDLSTHTVQSCWKKNETCLTLCPPTNK